MTHFMQTLQSFINTVSTWFAETAFGQTPEEAVAEGQLPTQRNQYYT